MTLSVRINQRRAEQNIKLEAIANQIKINFRITGCMICAIECTEVMRKDGGNAALVSVLDKHDNGQHGKGK